eukprot:6227291-Amphidinium_carterae.1
MVQSFWTKPGEVFPTKQTIYIVIEVERTPPQWSKEREGSKLAKPDWQFVLGKRGRKRDCDVLSFVVGCFPLRFANCFPLLERELDDDEEQFNSA